MSASFDIKKAIVYVKSILFETVSTPFQALGVVSILSVVLFLDTGRRSIKVQLDGRAWEVSIKEISAELVEK